MVYVNGTIINETQIKTACAYNYRDSNGFFQVGTMIIHIDDSSTRHRGFKPHELMAEIEKKNKELEG